MPVTKIRFQSIPPILNSKFEFKSSEKIQTLLGFSTISGNSVRYTRTMNKIGPSMDTVGPTCITASTDIQLE